MTRSLVRPVETRCVIKRPPFRPLHVPVTPIYTSCAPSLYIILAQSSVSRNNNKRRLLEATDRQAFFFATTSRLERNDSLNLHRLVASVAACTCPFPDYNDNNRTISQRPPAGWFSSAATDTTYYVLTTSPLYTLVTDVVILHSRPASHRIRSRDAM